MEKRFELEYYNAGLIDVYDNELNTKRVMGIEEIFDLLNEQDKKIKELKKEIKQLKFDCAMYKSANYLINDIGIDKAREIMFQSEKKLQQSQNSKVIEELKSLEKYMLEELKHPLHDKYDLASALMKEIRRIKTDLGGKNEQMQQL